MNENNIGFGKSWEDYGSERKGVGHYIKQISGFALILGAIIGITGPRILESYKARQLEKANDTVTVDSTHMLAKYGLPSKDEKDVFERYQEMIAAYNPSTKDSIKAIEEFTNIKVPLDMILKEYEKPGNKTILGDLKDIMDSNKVYDRYVWLIDKGKYEEAETLYENYGRIKLDDHDLGSLLIDLRKIKSFCKHVLLYQNYTMEHLKKVGVRKRKALQLNEECMKLDGLL